MINFVLQADGQQFIGLYRERRPLTIQGTNPDMGRSVDTLKNTRYR